MFARPACAARFSSVVAVAADLAREPGVARFFHRIILIERANMPGRELDPAEAAVRHFGAHRAADGIVVDHRRDAFFARFLEPMAHLGRAEVGLVLFDRLAFVVEDGLAVGDPAERLACRLGLRLNFLHHHAAHAVGILESGLQRALLTRRELADMLLAHDAAGAGGVCSPGDRAIRFAGLAEVVDVPGGGIAEPASCLRFVVGRSH